MDLADLDRDTLRELRSLGLTGNRVGKHLLSAASVVDTDPEEALRQLRAAVRRGARLPVVRETAGVVAYAAGDFALALRELRTATRLGVGSHLLPLIVDCERALGRPDRALELAAEAADLDPDTAAELAIVVSGIHRDAGDAAAALTDLPPTGAATSPSAGLRLRYARAEALLATGDSAAADKLFDEVARYDTGGITDAAERVAAAHGLLFDDIAEDDDPDLGATDHDDHDDEDRDDDQDRDDEDHDDADRNDPEVEPAAVEPAGVEPAGVAVEEVVGGGAQRAADPTVDQDADADADGEGTGAIASRLTASDPGERTVGSPAGSLQNDGGPVIDPDSEVG